ncbi:hypothetical protein [Rosistilla oblonga]|uniref:hypothetical protein n=1 Tax=Rosistilla oblonga TaxID=2527990 RepID=UPI003A96C4B4
MVIAFTTFDLVISIAADKRVFPLPPSSHRSQPAVDDIIPVAARVYRCRPPRSCHRPLGVERVSVVAADLMIVAIGGLVLFMANDFAFDALPPSTLTFSTLSKWISKLIFWWSTLRDRREPT